LPPGKYKVTVDAGGFAKFTTSEFDVNLGRTSTADASLQLASATATVQVTGGAVVDAAQNTTGSNVSTDQFSNFPTQRTVQSLYTIAPDRDAFRFERRSRSRSRSLRLPAPRDLKTTTSSTA
jgi:hypothetical protein